MTRLRSKKCFRSKTFPSSVEGRRSIFDDASSVEETSSTEDAEFRGIAESEFQPAGLVGDKINRVPDNLHGGVTLLNLIGH